MSVYSFISNYLLASIIVLFCLVFVIPPSLANATLPKTNPLLAFEGRWKIDEKGFHIVWDGQNKHVIDISQQISECNITNTGFSILCNVATPNTPAAQQGHMFWSLDDNVNPDNPTLHWLSHFTPNRHGSGKGKTNQEGNLTFNIRFEDEPAGHYRIYQWTWLNKDSYSMLSTQYRSDGMATGNWYGGTFVRAHSKNR